MTFAELKDFFFQQDRKLIIVADGEPRVSKMVKDTIVSEIPSGGVAVVLDPIAKATNATYIARAKTEEEVKLTGRNMLIHDFDGVYNLKRLVIPPEDMEDYYYNFSNQTLWPLCHVAFEMPLLNNKWFAGYKKVNEQYARAIKEEIKGKSLVWIHDYQLALVPELLGQQKDTIIGMFWHIPWPTWEIFRILPYRKEILKSLLACDFLAFHRRYQVQNFLDTVERELEVRIDHETRQVHYQNHVTTVKSLPLGIDTDVAKALVNNTEEETTLSRAIKEMLGIEEKENPLKHYFEKYKVIFGVDRLDYTKGVRHRFEAIDLFFQKNPQYVDKVIYLGILAPSREKIPSYKRVKKEAKELAQMINEKYQNNHWKPIHLIHQTFQREDIMNFYHRADICLVTPLDDGMNLVSKEYVIASSVSQHPGMLILSQFAGSAIDLTESLLVNPYDTEVVSDAIKKGLEMKSEEKKQRLDKMVKQLEENNVYKWAYDFLKGALESR